MSKTQEATDSNDLQQKDAEKDIVRISSLQKTDNQSNDHAEDNSQTQTSQKLDLTKNSKKLAKSVDVKALAESKVATSNQFNFDDWTTQIDNTYLNITGYNGDRSKQIVVPNGADFAKAGKNDQNLQVEIDKGTLAGLIVNGVAPKLSNTDGQKIVAKGNDWSKAFYNNNLQDISGLANLDTSNVTNMGSMFASNQISDLSPLANWNTGNVTNMGSMFASNQISNLSPLANWKTGNVTDMDQMFINNQISDLRGLANWNTGNVTDMVSMFASNQISDLSPLANWNTSNITNMSNMFYSNQISDLRGLASWNTGKVTDMSNMFENNQISDLTPLASWNTSKVTDMSLMFYRNQISDLKPLTNWNTSKVTDMGSMFASNQISNLSPLAHWNTSKVMVMIDMFASNQISNLSPLAHWNTSKVMVMIDMFGENPDIIDLRPIANWNISSITNNYYGHSGLAAFFAGDTKLDLANINNTPLMQAFLKEPDALSSAIFITNNADLVKATINQDLPNLTNTAKRTIVFNIPNADPTTIVQTINYKAVAPVQIDYYYDDNEKIVQTYPVKESDWQLDDSKQNDDVIIDGVIRFKPVKIPHVNGYKAYIVPNKSNPALFTVSFIAVPTENKPSTPVEETPSKPSAPTDNSSNSAGTDLKHKVVNTLNQSDSGWTMPENNSTYTVEVPDDAIIDLSDLVIAEPVHAQTRVKLAVTKHFKLSKKHSIKHLKHRKKAVKSFKKYRL